MKPVKCKCSRASALPLQCGICSINFYRASQPPSINLSITFQSNLSEFPTTCLFNQFALSVNLITLIVCKGMMDLNWERLKMDV